MRWPHVLACLCGALLWGGNVSAQPREGLQAALQAALQNHPSVTGKQAEVAASAFAGDAARAQRYPSVTASAQRFASTADAANLASSPVTLRLRQPLWAFGRIDANIAHADGSALVDKLDLVRVQRQLVDATAVAYARALAAQERQQVSADNVTRHADLLAQIKRRETGQVASVADVTLAQARWLQAVAQKNRHDSELQQALDELKAQTQLTVKVVEIDTPEVFSAAALDVLLDVAAEQSADIRLKKQKWEVAKLAVEQARLSSMPTVYMQGDRVPAVQANGVSANRYSVVLEGNLEGGGFVAAGKAKEALARAQAAEEDVRNAHNEMSRSLRSFVSTRDLSQSLVRQQKDSVVQLEALLASYKRQYEAGTKAWLDVLNMQRELSEQKLQSIQVQADWMTYALRLSALVGQLDERAGVSKD